MSDGGYWPGWPRLLSREQLCLYLGGICEETLAKVCPVAPLELGVRVLRWNRREIDAWLDALPSRVPVVHGANDNGDTGRQPVDLAENADARTAIMRARARAGAAAK
jgi:hypothetical protein